MTTTILLAMEIEDCQPDQAQQRLDAFRESVLPSIEYGLTIWRPTRDEVAALLPLSERVPR